MTRRGTPSAPTWSVRIHPPKWMDSKIHCGITIEWPAKDDDPAISEDLWMAQFCAEQRRVVHILARVAAMAAPHIYCDRVVHDCLKSALPVVFSSANIAEPPTLGTRDPSRDDADVCDMNLHPTSQLVGTKVDYYLGDAADLQLVFPKDKLPKYRFLVPQWLAAATADAGV